MENLKTSEQYYQEAIQRMEEIKVLKQSMIGSLILWLKSEIPGNWICSSSHKIDELIFRIQSETHVDSEFVEITYYHHLLPSCSGFRTIVFNDNESGDKAIYYSDDDIHAAGHRWKQLIKLANFK